MTALPTGLTARYGQDAATKLATAYEALILRMSDGHGDRLPDRATRLRAVEAMLAEGSRGGFDPESLTRAALAAARP